MLGAAFTRYWASRFNLGYNRREIGSLQWLKSSRGEHVVAILRSLILFLLSFCLFAEAIQSQEPSKEPQDMIVLPARTVHKGDYFAMGDSVEIAGEVDGDVYLLASQAVIDGKVTGDILVLGGSVEISGEVLNNVRAVAGQILISGKVKNNVTAVGGNVQLLSSANIGGNVVIVAGNVDLSAQIGSDATVVASNLRISSQIKNKVQAYVGQMRITSRSQIGGNVDYRSSNQAYIDEGAEIGGSVTMHSSLMQELTRETWIEGILVGSKVAAMLMNFLYTLVVAIILLKVYPRNLESTLEILHKRPWKALGFGLVLLIALPLTALVLLMTILGVPFALTLLAANVIGLYTAKVYSIFWASNWLFAKIGMKAGRLSTFCSGQVCYFALTAIPIFGLLIAFAAMLFGLGAGVLAQTKRSLFQR